MAAAVVMRPAAPSIGPGLKPRPRSLVCTSRTSSTRNAGAGEGVDRLAVSGGAGTVAGGAGLAAGATGRLAVGDGRVCSGEDGGNRGAAGSGAGDTGAAAALAILGAGSAG